MKLNNLTLEMKNIYGLEIQNEEEVKQQIINFVLLKINEFKTDKSGSELIFDVLNYINLNFTFNLKNELIEIKEPFLKIFKQELVSCLNPNNFKSFTKYGLEEFYFITKDIWAVVHYFSYEDVHDIEDLIKYNRLENFKINKKSTTKQLETVKDLILILKNKRIFNLKNFKLLDGLFFCDKDNRHAYFMVERNTKKVQNLKKEQKAIENYFKDKQPDFSEFLSFFEKNCFSKQETEILNNILIKLYNN